MKFIKKLINKLFKNKIKKERFNSASISKEVDSYSEWKKVNLRVKDVEMFFYIQPNISSFEIDKVIEDYGYFLEKYSKDIDGALDGDGSAARKIRYGILYAFVVRHKTDILSEEDKIIIKDINGEEMMTFAINFIKLNIFDAVMEEFDKESLNILFTKFNTVIETATKLNEVGVLVKDLQAKREKE